MKGQQQTGCVRHRRRGIVRTFLIILAFLPILAFAGAKETIFQAKQLLDNGQAKGAYRLLLPLEKEFAGFPEFDYLLGIAALDGDVPGYAVIALQRVIAMEPTFVGARIDLARAYYFLGEFGAARQEFETVLKFNPPAAVRELVVKYLDDIYRRQQGGDKTRFSFAVDGSAGKDSNANSATEAVTYQGFALSEQSRKLASGYVSYGATGSVAHQGSSRMTFYLGADVREKKVLDAAFVNSRIASGNANINYFSRSFNLNIGSQVFYTNTGGKYDSYNGVGVGQLQFMLGRHFKTTLMSRLSIAENPGDLSVQDNYSGIVGLGLGLVKDHGIIPATNVIALYGKTVARHAGSPYGNDFIGLRGTAIKPVDASLKLVGSAGLAKTSYAGLFGGSERIEYRGDATVSIDWRPTKGLVVTPSASYIYNHSGITIYKYDKIDYSLKIRKEF